MEQIEIWKDVVGYEGLYEISNLSRVRNSVNMRIRKQQIHKGYYMLMLFKNKSFKLETVHRLLMIAFVGNPENKPQCNHINGIKLDNNLENLEWCTRSENAVHAVRTGLTKLNVMYGEVNPKSKLKKEDIEYIKKNYKRWKTPARIFADKYGVSDTCIYYVLRGKSWEHLTPKT